MRPDPRLAVVIGTYNRLDALKVCIQSIYDQTATLCRIYVTDAGSTDGTVEYLRSAANDTLLPVFTTERLGQAKALNDVVATLDTPYVCWLSDDNEVDCHGLDVAVRILDEHPEIGMVALKVDDATRSPGTKPRYAGGISEIGVLTANQGLLRTDLMHNVGGFSEWLRGFAIDTDLTAKILFHGHDVVYTKDVTLHHHPVAEETKAARLARIEGLRIPGARYRRKWAAYRHESLGWRLGRAAWWLFQKVTRIDANSSRTLLGMNGRDWRNVLAARYIGALDPVRCLGRPYHLVQSCPRRLRLETLPPDGAEDDLDDLAAVLEHAPSPPRAARVPFRRALSVEIRRRLEVAGGTLPRPVEKELKGIAKRLRAAGST